LLPDGRLLRTGRMLNQTFDRDGGGQGGIVTLENWDGRATWNYVLSTDEVCQHHDVHMMPNGDVLLLVWEKKTAVELAAAGFNTALLPIDGVIWPDYLVEVRPAGTNGAEIVWEWHAWDHLIQDYAPTEANYGVVADHPELIDANYALAGVQDWMHSNAVDYNETTDQILVSVRAFSEIWVIDHSTTTAQAAGHRGGVRGHGGDLLYRWGNPAAYRQSPAARDFYGQHDGQWIAAGLPGAGHILVFNNGYERPDGDYSTADEFAPAVNADGSYPPPAPAYGPAGLSWTYVDTPPTAIFSLDMGGAQRLPNGNTLICVADTGAFMEVTPTGALVWEYVQPVSLNGVIPQGEQILLGENAAFRATRYLPDYPGLAGQDLSPGACLDPPCE
jgi:hypothetical protein